MHDENATTRLAKKTKGSLRRGTAVELVQNQSSQCITNLASGVAEMPETLTHHCFRQKRWGEISIPLAWRPSRGILTVRLEQAH